MDICNDNRFEVIERAKQDMLKCTNIDSRPEEMAVIDNILFRCWQMGWLDRYDDVNDDNTKYDVDNLEDMLQKLPDIKYNDDICTPKLRKYNTKWCVTWSNANDLIYDFFGPTPTAAVEAAYKSIVEQH